MGMNGFWKLCIKNRSVTVPAIIIVSITLLAVFAPMVTQYDETRQDLLMRLVPPQSGHIFGTDELGRDVFTRILYGTRVSLSIALLPTAIAVAVGTALGILSAYFGRWVDFAIMRLADIMLSIPGMLLAMVVLYTFGGSLSSVYIALVLMEWGSVARVTRAAAEGILGNDYVLAARAMGVRGYVIILRHIFPNLLPTMLVLFTVNIPSSILAESALSFLGIGIQPPKVSLGLMAGTSKQFLFQMPWLSLAPAGMIMLLSLSFNFLGDALRDVLDPKRRAV